jgi:hypothetical protein
LNKNKEAIEVAKPEVEILIEVERDLINKTVRENKMGNSLKTNTNNLKKDKEKEKVNQ